MPFSSRAQMRWMFATHPAMAKRWAAHTKSIKKLPEKKAAPEYRGTPPMTTLPELVVEMAEPLGAALAMGVKLASAKEAEGAELARRIPRIVAAMLDAKVLEPHEKAAMTATLRDPVHVVQVLENLLAQIQAGDVKTASAGSTALGRPAGTVAAPALPHLVGARSDGTRVSDQAFLAALGLN